MKGMPREQERDLIRRAQSGDGEAREQILLASQKLVRWVARKYENLGATLEDMIQEANLYLMRGVDQFDLSFGVRWSTYASWWARRGVLKAIEDSKIVRSSDERRVSQMTVSEEAALQAPEEPEDPCWEQKEKLRKVLRGLNNKDRRLVEMKFGLCGRPPMTLCEIGDVLGVSRETVRIILQRILGEVKWRME